MKLLTICPSRNRPDKLARMLQSFLDTSNQGTNIIVYVADDDPSIEEYKSMDYSKLIHFGPRRSLVKVLNYISTELIPGVPFYQEINDDHVYRTKNWDEVLIGAIRGNGGWGISCGNDLMTNESWEIARHPSGAVISGNIVRTLGHFVLPELDHLFTDTYLRDIAEGIERYYHLTDVIIEHLHPISCKADSDKNYEWVYNPQNYMIAHKHYYKWRKYRKADDIAKLKEAMNVGL